MLKIRISSGVKTALIILNEIFALLLIVVLILSSNYGVNSGSWDDLLARRSYEKSEYFQTQSVNQATRAIRAAVRATRFEENGVYDPSRFVNISEYAKNGIITGKYDSEGLYYRLGDLLNWAQGGWSYSTVEIDSEGYLTFHADHTSNVTALQEDLEKYFATSDYEWNAYYQYYQNVTGVTEDVAAENYQKSILNENYQPENYRNIVAYATDAGIDLSTIYEQMDKTLENIVSDVLSYRDNVNLFAPSVSNVRYFLVDRDLKQVYTNAEEYTKSSEKEIQEYVKSHGAFLWYDNQVLSVDVDNIQLSVTELYGYAEKYGMSGSNNYALAVAIDTAYPAQDVLYSGYEKYQSLQPIAWLALIAGAIGIVGYFITIVILTVKAGIDPDLSGIQLNWFDYWKTEIGIFTILLFAAIGIVPLYILDEYFSFLTTEGIIGFVALGENCIFLAGWLSLARRAKAKNIWTNSIAYSLSDIIRGTFENGKRTTKVLVLFGGYLFVNFMFDQLKGFGGFIQIFFNVTVAALLLREAIQDQKLLDGMKKLQEGDLEYQYEVEEFDGFRKEFATALNGVHQVFLNSVMESMKNERMQTDLITNVSHDIKTPLTSIINYVDLLKRENIENEKAKGYIEVLEQKSYRLKHLTEDLVEASKISSGNIKLECTQIHMQEMLYQASGEFVDKFESRNLTLVENIPQEPLYIRADGRRLWRVLENLFNNVAKYAMSNTRVYVDLLDLGNEIKFSIKNISEQRLNIDAKDLTERFIRGDISRSTEGSGLGLSIAKNLTEIQGGKFSVYLDGDLFRITITFPKLEALPEDMSIGVLEENIEASLEASLEENDETSEEK